MNDPIFVAYVADRFEGRILAIAAHDKNSGLTNNIDLPALAASTRTIVTHDVHLLVSVLRIAGVQQLPTVVDICELLKVRSQLSRDQGGERLWRTWRQAKAFFEVPEDANAIEDLLAARSAPPPDEQIISLAIAAARALCGLWTSCLEELRSINEFERFIEVEIPVQQIFHRRNLLGIPIDVAVISRAIKVCEGERFTLFRRIAAQLGFSPQGIDDRQLARLLLKVDEEKIEEDARSDFSLDDILSVASLRSSPAAVLSDYVKAKRDLSVLREIAVSGDRVFPLFTVHGTVTSRILVSDPRLQQLRKQFRSVIRAEEGHDLVYLDYAQFEPGILSVLADDADLQAAYESQDMYEALAIAAYDDVGNRDIAKRVFLAYLYGMTESRISSLLQTSDDPDSSDRVASEVVKFFGRFSSVQRFREESQAELKQWGRVGTSFGNFRKRTLEGRLSHKEMRWALNHRVQATASLIFKSALIRIAADMGHSALLLPMHDAVLLQRPLSEDRDRFVATAIEHMRAAFQNHCPGVRPKVAEVVFGL